MLLFPVAMATSVAGGVSLTPTRVASILLLGVLGTGVAYVLNYRIIADLGATKASLVTYIIPVVAVVVGILVLDEPFEARLLVGGALTVAGIAAVSSKPAAHACRNRASSAPETRAADAGTVRRAWPRTPGASTTATGTPRDGGTPPPPKPSPRCVRRWVPAT